jgi:pseudaminic acid biosynthesis-associated methylase
LDTRTEQEEFWAGSFGTDYVQRNDGSDLLAAKTALMAKVIARTGRITSALELGANIGLNLLAVRALLPKAALHGVEINRDAYDRLSSIPGVTATHGSLLDPHQGAIVDLSFTCGVLIHINPDRLSAAYDRLYAASQRFVMVAEYYNPAPVEVPYRGHAGRLFKRDFAGELLDRFPDLRLVDYGFFYRRDQAFPSDDLTWFLMEKTGAHR